MSRPHLVLWIIFVFTLLTCHACVQPRLPKIGIKGKWLRDPSGRVRLFHGFNAVKKSAPWYPAWLLNDTKLDLYKSWGFNAVRLGAMWTGAEPEEGNFNMTYFKTLGTILSKLDSRGIYAILDFHQDVLSSKFGTYDGIPLWVLDKLPPSPNPFPWPLPRVSDWSLGYLTQAVGRAFQSIYNNTSGARDMVANFWKKVAEYFKDFSNVLGYELMNEPWAGDIYSKPSLLLPGVAGRTNLQAFYDHLTEAIRTIDENTLIFYEPVTWGIFRNGEDSGSGFSHLPGQDRYHNHSVFSYHYYCWFINPTKKNSVSRKACDLILLPDVMRVVENEVKRLKGSSFLTEFGLCEEDLSECLAVIQAADSALQSWAYWDSNFFDNAGHVNQDVVHAFSRTYARAINGEPLEMQFNPDTAEFSLLYTPDPSRCYSEKTEIFIPEAYYQCGFKLVLSTGLIYEYDEREHCLFISVSDDVTCPEKASATIYPKTCRY